MSPSSEYLGPNPLAQLAYHATVEMRPLPEKGSATPGASQHQGRAYGPGAGAGEGASLTKD